jgi:hypothetical protein
MKKLNVFLGLCIFLTVVTVSSAAVITTHDATNITASTVILHGHLDTGTYDVWFEYGVDGNYIYQSEHQNITGPYVFGSNLSGLPLIPGQNYSFRAAGNLSGIYTVGGRKNFTLLEGELLPDRDFDKYYEILKGDELNLTRWSENITKPFEDLMGNIFWGLFWGIIFAALWIRQEDVTVPCLLGMVIGASLWELLPFEWVGVGQMLFIISFAGILYSLLKGRKK